MNDMNDLIRILIADDHPIVRQGLELVFSTHADLDIVSQATNGQEAVQLAKETKPDVIVLDLQMPVKDGLQAIEEINEAGLETQILVLTSFPDDDKVFAAIKAGASGIMLKDTPPEKLVEAIRTVNRGQSALHPTITRRLMHEVIEPVTVEELLTPREIEVLKHLARGDSNREIAQALSISVRTVTTHVRNILDKLGLSNRTKAALYAVDHGYVLDSNE
jgi:DNA-binding NarL/FixJ family response regulator